MVTFYDDDGDELKPISYKDFMAQGKDRMDKWLLKNEPTNKEERKFKEALEAERIAKLKRSADEYHTLTNKTKPRPNISDVRSNDEMDTLL